MGRFLPHFVGCLWGALFFLTSFGAVAQCIDSVIVGSGGGFTGQITAYKITQRRVEKGKGLVAIHYTDIATLKRKDAKAIKIATQSLWAQKLTIHRSANTYRFIEMHSGGQSSRLVWGDPSFQVPENVLSLYNQLSNTINTLTFSTK